MHKDEVPSSLLCLVLVVLVLLGSTNFVLLKIMYKAYGPQYSFFASQGVNLLYIMYGGTALAPLLCSGRIPAEQRSRPGLMQKFTTMGCLDTLGTFLVSMYRLDVCTKCTYTYTFTYMYMYIYTYKYRFMHIHIYVYIFIYVHVHIYMSIYTCSGSTYVYIHVHK